MRKSDLKGCTKAFICSAKEQFIQINYIKYSIDKTNESPLCRMCGTRNETISHIVSECGKLAQKEYKTEDDSVGRYVHWQKLGFSDHMLYSPIIIKIMIKTSANAVGPHHLKLKDTDED